MYPAEIRIREDDDLTEKMAVMRKWLDHRRFEPSAFRYTFVPPAIVLRVHFRIEAEAVEFAKEFNGRVISKFSSQEVVE